MKIQIPPPRCKTKLKSKFGTHYPVPAAGYPTVVVPASCGGEKIYPGRAEPEVLGAAVGSWRPASWGTDRRRAEPGQQTKWGRRRGAAEGAREATVGLPKI